MHFSFFYIEMGPRLPGTEELSYASQKPLQTVVSRHPFYVSVQENWLKTSIQIGGLDGFIYSSSKHLLTS